MAWTPGEIVAGRFELVERVGTGGMGAVWRARDRLTGEPVALKVLQSPDADGAARFRREARVLAALHHPGIVRYVAHGAAPDGAPFLAMEWLEGEDLGRRLRREGLTVEDSLALVRRAAEALGEAHGHGIVHRDLKPGNLFLVGGDPLRCKVIDFGIARLRPGDLDLTTGATLTGALLGTVGYLAPEQARGEPTVGPPADVFALGVVLYHCVTGQRPFTGVNATAVLAKILFEDPPRAREVRPDLSRALEDLLARALAKDPAARPPDGAALAREIAALADLGEAPVAPAVPALALTSGEQRFVSVVVGAPVDPGVPLADAETVRLDRLWSPRLREIADRHGARLERLADHSIVAALQVDATATDQAARAARLALALHACWPGPVAMATGRAEWIGRLPVGEAIDRALAVLRARLPDPITGVRVDEVTAGLLDTRFEVAGRPPVLELVRERPVAAVGRTLLGREIPCVGRAAELAALRGLVGRSVEESCAQAVLVTGPAGIGKSRLRHELVRGLLDVEVWEARADPLSAGSAYGLLAEIVRRAVGTSAGEPAEARWQAIRRRVVRRVPGPEVERVVTFLGELTGTPPPGEPSIELAAARRDPALLGDQVRRAFVDWLARECRAHPVLIVLEDLHWGDAPSIGLVDAALRALVEQPLCVVGIGRPEIHDLFPGLWAARGVQEVRVGELSRKSAERLVREALGAEVPADVVARVVERGGGNAFYLEELVRAVADGRGDHLPETVVAMAAARLDALGPEDRRILRAASVFGGACWRGGLVALLGGSESTGDVTVRLGSLQAREWLVRRRESRFPGEEEYAFRHALVREAAYAALTEADRTLGHRLVAAWLTAAGEEDARVLAEHWERGGDRAAAAAQWARAARAALRANDFPAAIERAERALACGVADAGSLRLLQAEASRWAGQFRDAADHARAALSVLPEGSAAWCQAAAERAEACGHLGEHDEVAAIAERLCEVPVALLEVGSAARAVAHLLHDGRFPLADRLLTRLVEAAEARPCTPSDDAHLHLALSYRAMYRGDSGASLAHDRAVVDAFRRAGDLRQTVRFENSVAFDCLEVGRYEEAERILEAALPVAERMQLGATVAIMRQNLGLVRLRRGRIDAAIAEQRQALAELEALGDARFTGASRLYLALALHASGDLVAADLEARRAIDDLSFSGTSQAYAFAVHAEILRALGRPAEALEAAGRGHRWLVELGAVEEGEAMVRLAWARALAANGRAEEATVALEEARERLRRRAERIEDPGIRRSFLEEVPDHAATLRG